jgi:hypothetical protein
MDKSRLQRYIEKMGHIEERVADIKTWLGEVEDVKEVEKKTRLFGGCEEMDEKEYNDRFCIFRKG